MKPGKVRGDRAFSDDQDQHGRQSRQRPPGQDRSSPARPSSSQDKSATTQSTKTGQNADRDKWISRAPAPSRAAVRRPGVHARVTPTTNCFDRLMPLAILISVPARDELPGR